MDKTQLIVIHLFTPCSFHHTLETYKTIFTSVKSSSRDHREKKNIQGWEGGADRRVTVYKMIKRNPMDHFVPFVS